MTVHVELIDAVTGKLLGATLLPVDQLPASFAASTTLHLAGGDWHVEHAEPTTRAEYAASGRLRLVIRKIEHVDPQELLFSLPSLENATPPMVDGDSSAAFAIHEDDWRQIELLSARFTPEVALELAAIRDVHAERVGPGWKRVHVRERIPQPFAGTEFRLAEVSAALGDPRRRTVTLGNTAGIVADGFALASGDETIYGLLDGDRVAVLAMTTVEAAAPLAALARAFDLVLVDWCRCVVARSDGSFVRDT